MRNDARPIGHDAADPTHAASESDSPSRVPPSAEGDARESITHDRQSHVVNKGAEEDARRGEAGTDPVMPVDDATLKTTI